MSSTSPNSNNSVQYFATALPAKAAVTVVAHGLNTQPMAMLPLIHWLNSNGSDVYLIQLSGHHSNGVPIQAVTATMWQQEMQSGYAVAKQTAVYNSVPFFFLGYSLGGLLGQSMIILQQEGASFDKQVLIAPATAIRSRSYWIKLLFFLGKQMRLPSFTPKGFRVNKSLPLSIYQILFAEEKKVLQSEFKQLHIPTLILIDPKDELISYQKLKRLIKRFSLTQYKIVVLDDDLKSREGKYHHLVLDEPTMGMENWERTKSIMQQFLFEKRQEEIGMDK